MIFFFLFMLFPAVQYQNINYRVSGFSYRKAATAVVDVWGGDNGGVTGCMEEHGSNP